MAIYMGPNRKFVSLYEIQFKFNLFSSSKYINKNNDELRYNVVI